MRRLVAALAIFAVAAGPALASGKSRHIKSRQIVTQHLIGTPTSASGPLTSGTARLKFSVTVTGAAVRR